MKEFQNITNKQIEQYGVQSLADRPNSTGGYGDKGLSALELKLAFDKFATFLAGKINEIHKVLAGDEAGEYIAVLLRDSGIENLAELVAAIESGKMAQILQLYPAASENERASLQNIVYDFAKTLSEHGKTISEVLKYPTYTESDPTVPKWAKAANKPSYTASEVGAAPAGFGLGVVSAPLITTEEELDLTNKSGFYRVAIAGKNWGGVLSNGGSLVVNGIVDGRTYQTVYLQSSNTVVRRYCYNSVWNEWEVENPPMLQGVEYRTTERYNGKPVYTKLVTFTTESISGSGTIMIPHDIANFDYCIDVKGRPYTIYVLPYVNGTESTAVNAVDATNIHLVYTNAKWSAATWRFKLSYTKTV